MCGVSETVNYSEKAKPVLKTMVKRIVENFNPIRVVLFGSYARGTPNFHSDIDLMVVMENGTDEYKTMVEIRRLLSDSPIAKDVIVTTPSETEKVGRVCGYAIYYALKEGVILYER